jgi:hypothetical protein
MGARAAKRREARMAAQEISGELEDLSEPDHAGSTLCRLLAGHPEVETTRALGCRSLPCGGMSYDVELVLGDGRSYVIEIGEM